MKCANCKYYYDGILYTSIPPKYRCTITNEFHLGDDDCNVEFAPVKHGRWIEDEYGIPHCSECKAINNTVYRYYCPNCGVKMDGGENGSCN